MSEKNSAGTPSQADLCAQAVESIRARTSKTATIAIVCGSGLGGIGKYITDEITIPYADIKGFPIPSNHVAGHRHSMVFGKLEGTDVICLLGRLHYYQGLSMQEITFPIRLLCSLGIKTVIMTNAAGGVNPRYNVGDVMIISDHVSFPSLAGNHPLRGANEDKFGPRFLPLSDACTYIHHPSYVPHSDHI